MSKIHKHHKVFLAGLEFDFNEEEVFSLFTSLYNSIISVEIVKQGRGNKHNKGFGFMTLGDPIEVNHMLNQVFFYLRGRKFLVKEHKEGDELEQEKDMFYRRRLFIKNVAVSVDNQQLWEYFSRLVELEDAYLIKTSKFGERRRFQAQGKDKGKRKLQYGFLVLRNLADVSRILSKRYYCIDGFEAEVEKFDKKKHQITTKNKKKRRGGEGEGAITRNQH